MASIDETCEALMADIITTKLAVTKLKRKKRLLLNELYRQFIEGEIDPKKRIKRDNDTSRSAVDSLTGMKINENEEFDDHNGVVASSATAAAVDDVEGTGVGGGTGGVDIAKPKAKRAPRKPKAKEEIKAEAEDENKTSEMVEEEGTADILNSSLNDSNSNSNSNDDNNNDNKNDDNNDS